MLYMDLFFFQIIDSNAGILDMYRTNFHTLVEIFLAKLLGPRFE